MEATASDIAQQDSVKTAKIKVIRNHQFILIFRSRLCRMIKKRGQAPVQFGAIEFQSRCVIGAVPGTGHARGLRLGGSRDLRLRRLRDQGARWIGVGSMWSHRRYVRARRPTLRQEATAASRAVTTLTPHPPAPASGRGGGRVSISCAVTYVGNAGKALCAKQPNSRFFCKIPYPLRLDASSALIHGPM